MRRFILLTSIIIFGFSQLTAQDTDQEKKARGNPRTIINMSIHNYEVSDTPYAHPQTLTLKQTARILSSVFIERGPGVPALNSEERMMLTPKVVKAFKTLKKNQQVKITKTWGLEQEDGKFHENRSFYIYLCFVKSDTLYVALLHKNWKQEEMYHLAQGHFMKWMENKDGKKLLNIVLMDKSLWTTNFNELVFEKNMDFDPEKIKQKIDKNTEQKGKLEGSKPTETEPATLTFEQLEKELKRLNDMKDRGLISEEEYKKARARLMKEAGIGK